MGSCATIRLTIFGSYFFVTKAAIGVLTIPGQTALMRMPRAA
jgi:hypothetical protein